MKESELTSLPTLSISYAPLKISKDPEGELRVFDPLRKKNVILTPEEFVRQNFIHYLSQQFGYPLSLMANEVEINLNNTRKRCDTVVYDRDCKPLIIVEYKAPKVEITQDTFDQIVRYNRELRAKYLIVTNGIRIFCCIMDYQRGTYNFVRHIPHYTQAELLRGIN